MVAWWWIPIAFVVGAFITIMYCVVRSSDDFFDDGGF